MESLDRPGGQSASWVEYTSPAGRAYYYNPATKKTTWEKPNELKSEQERLSVWKEYAKDGRAYWYNTETKKSTWTRPAELGDPASKPPAVAQAGPPVVRPSSPVPEQPRRAVPVAVERMPRREYRTQEEAEAAFLALLATHGVGSTWTWEQALREIVSDSDYRALKTLAERKDAFHKYTGKLREKEREEARVRAQQQREKFFDMMRELPISEVTRFRKVRCLAAEHPAFVEAGKDGERLFDEFMDLFIRDTRDRRRAAHDEGMRVLAAHLAGLKISAKWSDVKGELLDRFSHLLMPALKTETPPLDTPYMYGAPVDPECGLSLIDFMDAYDRAITDAERREAEGRQKEKDGVLRIQSQYRNAFRQLLEEHRAQITPASTWTQFFPLIKTDHRYIDLLGQPGSSPLELFWDHVELLEEDVYRERKRLESAMRDAGFRVHVDTAREEVKSFAAEFYHVPDYFDYIYEQLLMKARHKKEEEDERILRQHRRMLDDLRYALYDLVPRISADATWDEEKSRVERLPEFRALDDEPAARLVFDRVVEREREPRKSARSRDADTHKRSRSPSTGPPDSRAARRRTSTDNGMPVDDHDSELEEGEMVL
ncbi:U1 snRNP protein [Coemansia sp. IMI 209128]|nr:U1 snRNP protein [Coemansia sp. RSA 2530]KAJ2701006.1 U1 snRNP protein [Coemansia sp. IMI 209128]